MTADLSLFWPSCKRPIPLFPLFLPYSGCPRRCVFCAQDRQTGQPPRAPQDALREAAAALAQRAACRLPAPELAFYGGTFTALPPEQLTACLDFARLMRERGWSRGLRCSTRPDCVPAAVLARLREAGCRCVELGVQSFADAALRRSQRGYDAAAARAGCRAVRTAGLELGVQLMPGMPGSTPRSFLEDVRQALALGAACLRFYPCLVLEGTALAERWRAGEYRPWPLGITLEILADAYVLAQEARVPVIRMGLAPEDGLQAAVLAGPAHPALGARVQARALLRCAARELARSGVAGGERLGLVLPRRLQGMYLGHAGELRAAWQALGVDAGLTRFHDAEETIRLVRQDGFSPEAPAHKAGATPREQL